LYVRDPFAFRTPGPTNIAIPALGAKHTCFGNAAVACVIDVSNPPGDAVSLPVDDSAVVTVTMIIAVHVR
jgi:hypothetical protein